MFALDVAFPLAAASELVTQESALITATAISPIFAPEPTTD
jgi:hypothetical protein